VASACVGSNFIVLPLLRALARRPVRSQCSPRSLCRYVAREFPADLPHATVFYQAISERLVEPQRMVQIGVAVAGRA
jgi:hypothetical protein